ncbi:type II secretion system protein [uncultured Pseudacidovorax sp.]|uniref:type II secretion system protein n=1 Tax=uncultured Pseudacidovorax sp. TaxID=679313 RepID=UPI0025CDB83E|nr:type II secretion system protein [uncultured Pseudacidovorax sp.]
MKRIRQRHAQRGISILEVVIALLILGLLTVAAWKLQRGAIEATREAIDTDLVTRADQSIRTFIARQSRLPCPATSNTGVENCAAGMASRVGFVPWVTVGLPDAGGGSLRYAIDKDALAQAAPGLGVINLDLASGPGVVGFDQASTDRTVHWCNLVGKAMKAAPTGRVPRAYQVFSPGVGAGANTAAGALDAAGAQVTRTLPELWGELNCGGLVAGAGRAYMNAALAARMMALAAKEQLTLSNMNLDAAKASYFYNIVDLVTEAARQPSKVANVFATCANAASLTADVVTGMATVPQYVAQPGAIAACGSSGLDVAVHIGYLLEKIDALKGLALNLASAAEQAQQAHDDEASQAQALADAIAARARAAIADGMNLD